MSIAATSIPSMELPTISSDDSDSDVEEILFSGNTWSTENPGSGPNQADESVRAPGSDTAAESWHRQSTLHELTTADSVQQPKEPGAAEDLPRDVNGTVHVHEVTNYGAPALHCGLDDFELSALIARLQQGKDADADSICSKVFSDLPPASELFSDEEDTDVGTSKPDEAPATDASGKVMSSKSHHKQETFGHKGLRTPFLSSTKVTVDPVAFAASQGTAPKPTLVLDLRAASSNEGGNARAWPALPQGLLMKRVPEVRVASSEDDQSDGTGSDVEASGSDSDDGVEAEFNNWIRSRAEMKAKYGSSVPASKAGLVFKQVASASNQPAAVAWQVVRQDSATSAPPATLPSASTKSTFVCANLAAASQGSNATPTSTAKPKAEHEALNISIQSSASGGPRARKSDTEVVSDKTQDKHQVQSALHLGIDTSDIQHIHAADACEPVVHTDSCTSPPSLTMSVMTDVPSAAKQIHTACVIATDCDLDSWSEDDLPHIPASASSQPLQSTDISCSSSGEDDDALAESQLLVESLAISATVDVLQAQPTPAEPLQRSAKLDAPARHSLALQLLPPSTSISHDANFVIAAHVPQADICAIASTTEWLLQLQSDPFSTIPEFSLASAVVVQASAVSQKLGLPEEGAVVLLAATSAMQDTGSSSAEVLSELSSYLQNATDHNGMQVVFLPSWSLFQDVSSWRAVTEATTMLDGSQEIVITLAKGTAVLASADVLPTTLMRMARAGFKLHGLQTAYMDSEQSSALNRVSQLASAADSQCVFIAAVGPAGSAARWKAELGPTFGDVAAVTDPMSLHAELKDVCATLTCSYDRGAAVKELELLWPTKVAGAAELQQAENLLLLNQQSPAQSAWIKMSTSSAPDLIVALNTVQFLGAAGLSVLHVCNTGQQVPPSPCGSSSQLLLEVEAPACRSTLEAISQQVSQAGCTLQLEVVHPSTASSDQQISPAAALHQRCCEQPPFYASPDDVTSTSSHSPPAPGTLQCIGIAMHATQHGAAAGCLAALLDQARQRCPLVQAVGVKLLKQLSAPVQQLFSICHTEDPAIRHVKSPALVAILLGVDIYPALHDLTTNPTFSCTGTASDRMAFLNSSFFSCPPPAPCTIGITHNTQCAIQLMHKCFAENQLRLDADLHSAKLLPEMPVTTGTGVYASIHQLLQSFPTICTLLDSTGLQSQFDRLLGVLQRDGFEVVQAATVQLWRDLAQQLGCAEHDGERAVCLVLSRQNAVQRLQHLLGASGLDKCGFTACPSYHAVLDAKRSLEAPQTSSQGGAANARPLHKGLMQTTCLFVPAASTGSTWASIGEAWHEMHEDGFKLVGIATVRSKQVLQLPGLSKLPAKEPQSVVAVAVARQNAITRCAMRLQDSSKIPSDRRGVAAIANEAFCCMSSKSVAEAVSHFFPHGVL